MHTCSEYTYRTHRQNVIDGLSRNQYITTKILFIIALALFASIITFITAFVIGISSDSAISFKNFRHIYYFFVQAMAYLSFAFLFALLLKKSAFTIGLFFVYLFIIENLVENYVNKINTGIDKIGGFLPIASSDHLLLPNEVKIMLKMIVNIEEPHPEYVYLIVSIVYIILCYLACYYKYKKQDL
jgi:ABC-type transport system involved in multi-copper enzyme maturation permease subunit